MYTKGIERKDESFCHSDSNRTLSCPDISFIDMYPGGAYAPLAVFIPDFSCPEASNRQSVLSDIISECQIQAIDLLMRQESNIICYKVSIICMFKLQIYLE